MSRQRPRLVEHLAGPLIDLVQRCRRCHVVLSDYRNAMVSPGSGPLRGWREGQRLVVEAHGTVTAYAARQILDAGPAVIAAVCDERPFCEAPPEKVPFWETADQAQRDLVDHDVRLVVEERGGVPESAVLKVARVDPSDDVLRLGVEYRNASGESQAVEVTFRMKPAELG